MARNMTKKTKIDVIDQENEQSVVLLNDMRAEDIISAGQEVEVVITHESEDHDRANTGGCYHEGYRIYRVETIKGDRYAAIFNTMLKSDFEDQGWGQVIVFKTLEDAVKKLTPQIDVIDKRTIEIKRGECPLCMGIFNRPDIDEITVKFSDWDFSGDVCPNDCGHSFRVHEGVISLI